MISQAVKACDRYLHKLETERERSNERLESVTKVAGETEKKLRKARAELDEVRREIFEKVQSGLPPDQQSFSPWVPNPMRQGTLPEYYSKDPTFPLPNAPVAQPVHKTSLPAGGFKNITGDGIALASPTVSSPTFPDAPEFSFPVSAKRATPGFRVASLHDKSLPSIPTTSTEGDSSDVAFPVPSLGRINPFAAYMLLHANDSDSGDEKSVLGEPPKMPVPSGATSSTSAPSMPEATSPTTKKDTTPILSMPQAPGTKNTATPTSTTAPPMPKSPVFPTMTPTTAQMMPAPQTKDNAATITTGVQGVSLTDKGSVTKDTSSKAKDGSTAPSMPMAPGQSK